jgi:hypothetical protein
LIKFNFLIYDQCHGVHILKKPSGWMVFLGFENVQCSSINSFLGFIKLSISKGPSKNWNLKQLFTFINMLKGLNQHQYLFNFWWQTQMLCIAKCCNYISNMWMWNIIDNNNYFSYLIAHWCFLGSIVHDWFFFFPMSLFICWRKFMYYINYYPLFLALSK